MLKYLLAFIILVHGLIHFMGFAKAFNYGNITQLTKEISKPSGLIWMLTAFLFITATVLFLLKKDAWLFFGVTAVIISQILIFTVWQDAKFGTIANIIILAITISMVVCTTMKKTFEKERIEEIRKSDSANVIEPLTEEKIKDIPEPIKKYLRKCGYVNKSIVFNADVFWKESYIRLKPDKDWTELTTKQFNSVKPISRIAYMEFKTMPVTGRDIYRNGQGNMNGKLFNLIPIINGKGKEVSQSSLITIFCEFLFIPGYIMQDYVKWEYLDEKTVRATVFDEGFIVTGIFHFDNEGLFSRFETEDRYYTDEKGKYAKTSFSAIVDSYQTQDSIIIPEKVRIVWHLKNGDYEYYKGTISKIVINVAE